MKECAGAEQIRKMDIVVGKRRTRYKASIARLNSARLRMLDLSHRFSTGYAGLCAGYFYSHIGNIYIRLSYKSSEKARSRSEIEMVLTGDALGDIIALPYQYLCHWEV